MPRGCPNSSLLTTPKSARVPFPHGEGGRSVPNVDMLITLARAFGVRPGERLDAVVDETEKEVPPRWKTAS